MKLSIVSTLYRSAGTIEEFCGRVSAEAAKLTDDYEIVLVNDGSPDDSLAVALRLRQNHPKIKVVDLSRNFGHHKAIMAGLSHARGEHVFLIDVDLEEPPELLGQFWARMAQDDKPDVVYGMQTRRKGGFVERTFGGLFWKAINVGLPTPIPDNPLTVRLMSRRYVNALCEHREASLFLAGLFSATGFEQRGLEVQKACRATSSYNFLRRARLCIDAMASFSTLPLWFIFYFGVGTAMLSAVFMLYFLALKLVRGEAIQIGWASMICSLWFVAGVISIATGVIGIYMAKLMAEVKHRPNWIVRDFYS
jgi:putative glycosyltransferase